MEPSTISRRCWSLYSYPLSIYTLRTGFTQAILHTLRIQPGWLLVLGPPCSSFVWMNRSTSGRHQGRPYGFEDRGYVELGSLNLDRRRLDVPFLRIAARAILLLILATSRGVHCLLEQPVTSTMRYFPDLRMAGALIEKFIGGWRRQFLPSPQIPLFSRWCGQVDGHLGCCLAERHPRLGHCAGSSIFSIP